MTQPIGSDTVYPKKYAHGFVVLCFVVVMQPFIINSHEVFIHIHQGCFAGTGAIVRLPQCQWSKPDGYGKTSQCITTTKHSKAKTVCIFLGIYCNGLPPGRNQAIIWTIAEIWLVGSLRTNFSELCIIIYIFFFLRENEFGNDKILAAILSWPQCVKHIQNDEIMSMTVQPLSHLCVPLNPCLYCQWHNLIYL